MGILLVVNRYLVSNSKSQLLKFLSSSNLQFIRRISSPAVHDSAGLCEAQLHAPSLVGGDLNSNNNNKKPVFLIEHFHSGSGNYKAFWDPSPPPYNYTLISAENSWTDHRSLSNPFSGLGECSLTNSCNELMLMYLSGNQCLWNQTTNEIKILPESDVPAPPPNVLTCRNAYVPYTDTIRYGFGFDPESEDYKLITFVVYNYEDGSHTFLGGPNVEMYSLKTNSWKKINAHPCHNVPRPKPSVHVNGVYYWGDLSNKPPTILSFDFASEKFSSIPLPSEFIDCKRGLFECGFVLVEFDGSLAALVHSELENTEKPFSFEVWGWNGEFWFQRMSRITIGVPGGVVKVVGLFQNDKLFLQGFNNGELLLFDLAESKLENLGIRADPHDVRIFPYVGSSVMFDTMGNK